MKLAFALLAAAVGAASATTTIEHGAAIPSNSVMGKSLLQKARHLGGDDNAEVDYSWIADYSIKFQGCTHVSQWNAEQGGEEDVKIATKRLVRFRLCESSSCSDESGYGCKTGYGDYVVDMNEFINAFLENKEATGEAACEAYKENCVCENNGDDAYDEDACMASCYSEVGMDYCIKDENGIEVKDYMECAQYNPPENKYYNRKLEEAVYFLGPYCADQGGKIHLGLFTDDTCTDFADDLGYGGRTTFESISYGMTMPYASKSLIHGDCTKCMVEQEYYDNYAEVEINELCTNMYMNSGKCEENLSSLSKELR
jgi:hypothetical protein